jgi:predicted phage-related endonuclease
MHEETGIPVAGDYSLEVRSREIGGSDAAAIMGVHPTRSRMDVWMEKKGMLEKRPVSNQMRFGKFVQPFIGELYAETNLVSGQTLIVSDQYDRLHLFSCPENYAGGHDYGDIPEGLKITHPEYPFIVGHLDGFVIAEGSKWPDILWPIEGKSYNAHAAKQWGEDDDIPDYIYAQCQQYLAILPKDFIDIPVLIGNASDFTVRRIPRHDEFIKILIEKEVEFKAMLDEDRAPEIDASDASMQYIKSLRPKDGIEIIVDEKHEIYPMVAEFKARKEALKEIEAEMDLWKNRVGEAMVKAGAAKLRILSQAINGSISFSGGKDTTKTAWKEALVALVTAIKYAHPDFDTDSIIKKFTEETKTPVQFRPIFK